MIWFAPINKSFSHLVVMLLLIEVDLQLVVLELQSMIFILPILGQLNVWLLPFAAHSG